MRARLFFFVYKPLTRKPIDYQSGGPESPNKILVPGGIFSELELLPRKLCIATAPILPEKPNSTGGPEIKIRESERLETKKCELSGGRPARPGMIGMTPNPNKA